MIVPGRAGILQLGLDLFDDRILVLELSLPILNDGFVYPGELAIILFDGIERTDSDVRFDGQTKVFDRHGDRGIVERPDDPTLGVPGSTQR